MKLPETCRNASVVLQGEKIINDCGVHPSDPQASPIIGRVNFDRWSCEIKLRKHVGPGGLTLPQGHVIEITSLKNGGDGIGEKLDSPVLETEKDPWIREIWCNRNEFPFVRSPKTCSDGTCGKVKDLPPLASTYRGLIVHDLARLFGEKVRVVLP